MYPYKTQTLTHQHICAQAYLHECTLIFTHAHYNMEPLYVYTADILYPAFLPLQLILQVYFW